MVVNGDTKREGDETFTVNLANAANATIADGQGVGTISNDDGTPSLVIADVKVIEGNAGTVNAVFTVSLSNTSDQKVSVDWATADGTATLANLDYVAASGTLSIPPKTSTGTITVVVNGDTKREGDETFTVNLANAANATIGDGQAVGTISNDDGTPSVSIGDVSGGRGQRRRGQRGVHGEPVQHQRPEGVGRLRHRRRQRDDRERRLRRDGGTLSIPPKASSAVITVVVNGDTRFESDETFTVNLSNAVNASIADGQAVGTISNDDGQPTLSIGDVSVTEGNAGAVNAVFTIVLSSPAGVPVSVSWATADGSATTANNDLRRRGRRGDDPGQADVGHGDGGGERRHRERGERRRSRST